MIRVNFKILFLFYFLFLRLLSFSQENSSFHEDNLKYDSILNSDYLFANFLFYKYNNDVLVNDLGTFGSLRYDITTKNNKKDGKDKYIFDKLKGIKPFTNISYINASRKEQIFKIKHYQQFGQHINFKLLLDKISVPGEFLNQEVNITNFNSSLKYYNLSYMVKFILGINKTLQQENGGLLDTKDFENNLYNTYKSYNVNLFSSSTLKKRKHFVLQQELTLYNLSVDSSFKKIYLASLNIFESKKRIFNDNDPLASIYKDVFLDSNSTIDSIYQRSFNNELFLGFKTPTIDLSVFTSYNHLNYYQTYTIDTNYNDVFVGVKANKKGEKLNLQLMSQYAVFGYRNGDVNAKFNIKYNITSKVILSFNVNYALSEPLLNYKNYNSNHFKWDNYSFNKQNETVFNSKLNFKHLNLSITADNRIIKDALYFNSLAIASQEKNLITLSTFGIAKDYTVFKFHFRSALKYQTTSEKIIFPLPQFIGRQLFYYENKFFKKVLKFQIGFNFSYSTGYYGYAYMPALAAFYTQDNTPLGYYPKIDVFINTHIKRAQIFLKYEHINSGRSLNKSYTAKGYPILSKSLKFGVSWNFVD